MTKKKHWRVYVPTVIGAILGLLGVYLVFTWIMGFVEHKPNKAEKKIQPIALLKPPPPPPPPPKVEKLPEPEVKQKIEEPEPEPEPEPQPEEAPARDLGLDAEGTAGSDGFGLAARKGGTGLFGGGGSPFAYYGNMIKNDILGLLSGHDELRRKGYTAIVKLWVKSDGSVERFELVKGSNDAEIDQILNRNLEKLKKIGEPPPPGMPQPIKLKITTRI